MASRHASAAPRQADDVNFAGTPPAPATSPPARRSRCPAARTPTAPTRSGSGRRQPRALAARPAAGRSPELPGARRPRPVLRLRPREHGQRRSSARARPTPRQPDRRRRIPPEVEITSPEWYEQVDPAPGEPRRRRARSTRAAPPTPAELSSPPASTRTTPDHGHAARRLRAGRRTAGATASTVHTAAIDGALARTSTSAALEGALPGRFPPGTDFTGREPGGQRARPRTGARTPTPYAFIVKVVVSATSGGAPAMTGEDQRAAYLHRDQDMLAGFPKAIVAGGEITQPATADRRRRVLARARRPRRRQPQRADLRRLRRLRPRAAPATAPSSPGWPVRSDPAAVLRNHLGDARLRQRRGRRRTVGGAILASVAVGDPDHDGVPRSTPPTCEGKVYGWGAGRHPGLQRGVEPGLLRQAAGSPFEQRRASGEAQPHRARLHRLAGARRPRRRRHRGADRGRDGPPRLRLEPTTRPAAPVSPASRSWSSTRPRSSRSTRSDRTQVTFKPDAGGQQQGAIVDTPAVGDLDGDGTARDRRRHERGVRRRDRTTAASTPAPARPSTCSGAGRRRSSTAAATPCDPSTRRSTRQLATLRDPADATPARRRSRPAGRRRWPASLAAELLPVVGEGVTGQPGDRPRRTARAAAPGPRSARLGQQRPRLHLQPGRQSCYGDGPDGHDIPLQTDVYGEPARRPPDAAGGRPPGVRRPRRRRRATPLHHAGGRRRPGARRRLPRVPAAGQDFLAAWTTAASGQLQPGFPATMNDLQFLTGPSVADIDGAARARRSSRARASKDLAAFSARRHAGLPAGRS